MYIYIIFGGTRSKFVIFKHVILVVLLEKQFLKFFLQFSNQYGVLCEASIVTLRCTFLLTSEVFVAMLDASNSP